ncbi:MAG TPA: class I SAM-dependent methyltransferase [Streptosporangiaceae bacterium]|nr:class I SAM-dependent methyltransferase [Streptosporangiaceae bacterium]
MSSARSSAFRSRGEREAGESAKGITNSVAWSRVPAPPATRCAWCDHPFDGTEEHRAGRVRCARCGVATTSPWPSEEHLNEAYGAWYRPDSGRFAGLGDTVLRRTRGALARRLHPILPPGPVLDVGAGDGTLVEAFTRHGREAVGLEPYGSGPYIRNAEIEEMGGNWAAVIFWHSLEHLRQPASALSHAASLLVPGGMLVVAVPNATSIQARAFGDRWLALDLPRHLVHLSPAPLLSKIETLGLRVERVSYLRGGQVVFGWVHGLVGRLPGQPDLYDVIRRGDARRTAQGPARRLGTLAAAAVAVPVALAGTAVEVAARAGGTIYVQARRGPAPEQTEAP